MEPNEKNLVKTTYLHFCHILTVFSNLPLKSSCWCISGTWVSPLKFTGARFCMTQNNCLRLVSWWLSRSQSYLEGRCFMLALSVHEKWSSIFGHELIFCWLFLLTEHGESCNPTNCLQACSTQEPQLSAVPFPTARSQSVWESRKPQPFTSRRSRDAVHR